MNQRIHGLTVCVNYADYLLITMPQWLRGLASLTIVTTVSDTETHRVAALYDKHPLRVPLTIYRTDAFTRDGAVFNKGLAMEEGRMLMPWEDWILFFDSDVTPEPTWRDQLPELQMGYLYGCKRHACRDQRQLGDRTLPYEDDDRPGYGYFQLFHSKDPKVQKTPLLDTWWRHAGNYDSEFLLSFRSMTQELPLHLWHLGTRGNWFGRDHRSDMQDLEKLRAGRGIHPDEKL